MSESNPAFPPGTRMYYRSSDSEPWTELDSLSRLGVDPADGADRSVIIDMDGTTTTGIPYDPTEVSRLIQKLGIHGEPPAPSHVAKARSLLEGKPVPKRKPATARHVAGRNDPCPCGSGRKYKRCHRLQT